MPPIDRSEVVFNKIRDLYELYDKVKQVIIYAENFDPKKELYIAPLNELRSALDHIFKAVNSEDLSDVEYELKEAREHLDRAGYDAFEVFASNLGIAIIKDIKPYSSDTLNNVFPDYYKVIRPEINKIKVVIGKIRKRKKDSTVKHDLTPFERYYDNIEKLLNYHDVISNQIPTLHEYQKKRGREKIFIYLLGVATTLICGALIKYGIHEKRTEPNPSSKIETIKPATNNSQNSSTIQMPTKTSK